MNNRHRRIARLKVQESSAQERKIKRFAADAGLVASYAAKKASEFIYAFNRLVGEAFEFYGTGLARIGKTIQGKETATLMNDLTTDEWIVLSRYIRGDLYIGGQNEKREEQIELFRSAAIKIIRIGDVLEGDKL